MATGAKVRNHTIIEMMKEHGIERVAELCRQAKLHSTKVGAIINGKESPWNKNGSWCLTVENLAEFFHCLPEDLFFGEFMEERVTAELTFGQAHVLGANINAENAHPEKMCEQAELKRLIARIIKMLTPREERIIRLKFGIGMSREYSCVEIARMFDVTEERIKQIECKALRKLKFPAYSDYVRQFLAGDNENRKAENRILKRRARGEDFVPHF